VIEKSALSHLAWFRGIDNERFIVFVDDVIVFVCPTLFFNRSEVTEGKASLIIEEKFDLHPRIGE